MLATGTNGSSLESNSNTILVLVTTKISGVTTKRAEDSINSLGSEVKRSSRNSRPRRIEI